MQSFSLHIVLQGGLRCIRPRRLYPIIGDGMSYKAMMFYKLGMGVLDALLLRSWAGISMRFTEYGADGTKACLHAPESGSPNVQKP